jgi:arabinose-5-phosphate isomerase
MMQSIAKQVFENQALAISRARSRIGPEFDRAVEMILATKGRIIISGMGKSGIIGKKIAATLSSTGTPSFTVHPGEAYHGDLGMITPDDTVMLISHSGETEEVIRLIPSIRRFGAPIIALAGNLYSTLARNADVVLDVSVEREAYPYIQFPTSSSTVTLVMGDALAVALVERRKFRPQDFALLHPAGSASRLSSIRTKSNSAFQEKELTPLKSSVPG